MQETAEPLGAVLRDTAVLRRCSEVSVSWGHHNEAPTASARDAYLVPPLPLSHYEGIVFTQHFPLNKYYTGMRKDKHSASFGSPGSANKLGPLVIHCVSEVITNLLSNSSFCPRPSVPLLHARVQEPGPRHRRLSQTLEEVCGVRMSGKGEIPTGVEEQNLTPETVHDESPEA